MRPSSDWSSAVRPFNLRVAQVLPAFFGDRLDFMGGGDRYVYKLAGALRPYCDVTFFSFGPRPREQDVAGLRHVVLPVRFSRNADDPLPGSLAYADRRFDIVHMHHLWSKATMLAAVVRSASRRPVVVTDHGGGGGRLIRRSGMYRLVSAFVCQSDFARALLPAPARRRAVVIKGGLDLGRFQYQPGPRSRQVLQVGRIMPHKGINYLIEAAGTDIPAVIAGKVVNDGYYRDLQKQAEGKPVRFLIDADDDAILAELGRSAVTMAGSVYRDVYGGSWPTSELLGLTLLESMSVGTPVICTDVGGMPEFVRDGVTGFIVPPNDPVALRGRILRILDDPAGAARMGAAGHEHVTQYSWDAVAQKLLAEYTRILG